MSHSLIRAAAVLALGGAALAAQADTVKLTDFTFSPATSLSVSVPSYSGPAGQYTGLLNGSSFTTYCTELKQTIGFGTLYTDFSIVDGVTAWGAAKSQDLNRALSYFAASGMPTDAATSAAAQAVVWEILNETGSSYDFGSGSFVASSGDAATQAALNAVNWATIQGTAITVTVDQLYSREHQNLLVTTPVPEPSAYAMVLAGFGVLGFVARRRARKA